MGVLPTQDGYKFTTFLQVFQLFFSFHKLNYFAKYIYITLTSIDTVNGLQHKFSIKRNFTFLFTNIIVKDCLTINNKYDFDRS